MSDESATIVRKHNRIHIERLELRRLLSGATFEVVDATTIINNFLSEIVVAAGSETPAGAEPAASDAPVQPDSGEVLIVQLPDIGVVDIGGGSSSEPASEIVDTTPTTDDAIIVEEPAVATPLEQQPVDPATPQAVDETQLTTDPVPEIDPVVPIDTGIDTGVDSGVDLTDPATPTETTDPLTPVIDFETDPATDPLTPIVDVELPTDTIDPTALPELPAFSDDPIIDLNPTETTPDDVFGNDPYPADTSEELMPDLPPVVIDDAPEMPEMGGSEVVVVPPPAMHPTPPRQTTATPVVEPARPVASNPMESQPMAATAVASAATSTPVATQVTTTSEPATTATVRAQTASQQSSGRESATASAAQAPAEPARTVVAPETPAPQPELAAIGADIDSTGHRDVALGQELGPDGKIKLVRVVWTFLDEAPIEQNQNESEAPAEPAQATEPVAAEIAVPAAAVQGPLVIQLVQEVDVAPGSPEAAAAAAQAAGAVAQAGEIEFASAGIGGLAESGGTGRNIALALVAGAATVGVQWYRTSKRKLAAAARFAFDPLGAWLDDSDYRE